MTSTEYIATPKPPPELNIPSGSSTVNVSIIDTTSYLTIPMSLMVQPVVGKFETVRVPAYSFLISHPSSGRNMLFDLGIRKDFENSPAPIVNRIKKGGWHVETEKNVADILPEHGIGLEDIEAIIWSHYHWDHTGDPSTFPPGTALIVGPGVKERFPTGYPTKENAVVHETAWKGRELKEVSFEDASVKIGRFNAVDYFGDGSFYILDTPGHLLGHLCGLARTTEDSFIFMGGDAAHHCGEIRPTEFRPLPKSVELVPNPRHFPCPCPGELLMQEVHPNQSGTEPFYKAADGFNEDTEVADWTIHGVSEFDADDRVLVAIAHDASLLDIMDFFPKPANEWKSLGWGRKLRWRFLADFSSSLEEAKRAGKL